VGLDASNLEEVIGVGNRKIEKLDASKSPDPPNQGGALERTVRGVGGAVGIGEFDFASTALFAALRSGRISAPCQRS
jgi:hypothetical protein